MANAATKSVQGTTGSDDSATEGPQSKKARKAARQSDPVSWPPCPLPAAAASGLRGDPPPPYGHGLRRTGLCFPCPFSKTQRQKRHAQVHLGRRAIYLACKANDQAAALHHYRQMLAGLDPERRLDADLYNTLIHICSGGWMRREGMAG